MTPFVAVLAAAALAAAACDIKSRRIPNVLTGALAVAGVVTAGMSRGLPGAGVALATLAVMLLIGTYAFARGWFGGGDVKLLAACCGLAGLPGSIALVLYVLVAGALLALVTAAARGRLVSLVRSTTLVAARGTPSQTTLLPYGVAIAGGSFAYAASTVVPALRLPL